MFPYGTPEAIYEQKRQICVSILASMPWILLEALLKDTFSEKSLNPELQLYFNKDHEWTQRGAADFVPQIYCCVLMNDQGVSPTPLTLRKVLKVLRAYVSGDPDMDEQNMDLDNEFGQGRCDLSAIRAGRHFYLQGKYERGMQVLTFCHALETHLDKNYPRDDAVKAGLPMQEKLKYFGFSTNEVGRHDTRDAHSSNFLSTSFMAALKLVDRHDQRGQNSYEPTFSFQTFVIAYLAGEVECSLGRELLTRMGNGYYTTGVGFNTAPASIDTSLVSLQNVSFPEGLALWRACAEFRERNEQFVEQLEADTNLRLERYMKYLKAHESPEEMQKARERIARIEKRLAELPDRIEDMKVKRQKAIDISKDEPSSLSKHYDKEILRLENLLATAPNLDDLRMCVSD